MIEDSLSTAGAMPTVVQIAAITTTFASRKQAEDCGRRLVDGRLAACVQVEGPMTSVYRWQGSTETATEWRCTCKTSVERQASCVAAIIADHGYAIPQITVAELACSASYAAWVRESVTCA